jgi:Flp pilus assembly protein TadD
VNSGEWDRANRLADETQARTSSGDFAGMYELAFELVKIPGRREQAISVFREVVQGNPRQPDPLLILGTVLEKAGDPEAEVHRLGTKGVEGPDA